MGAGCIHRAYAVNRVRMNREMIEADPIAVAIRSLMAQKPEWSGTATELLRDLERIVGDKEAGRKSWPMSAAALGGRLRRIAPPLRRIGIKVDSGADSKREGKGRTRMIAITTTGKNKNMKVRKMLSAPSALSASSAPPAAKSLKNKVGGRRTAADGELQTTGSADGDGRDDDGTVTVSPDLFRYAKRRRE